MKNLLLSSSLLIFFSTTFSPVQTSSCNQSKSTEVRVCNVQGNYSGMNTSVSGSTSPIFYSLRANNLATGSVSVDEGPVTFGGYRNTCDSVILSVYYTGNSSYYLLQGKLSRDKKSISGAFTNLTDRSDFGSFTMSK
jgi:hypothetical protein